MNPYNPHGPVHPDHPSFISRSDAIANIATCIMREPICGYPAIIAAPQKGKTTLLNQLEAQYRKNNWSCVRISFLGWEKLEPASVYRKIVEESLRQLNLALPMVPTTIDNTVDFQSFLKMLAIACQYSRLVFLYDRIDGLQDTAGLSLGQALRGVFEEGCRGVKECQKIVCILTGSKKLFNLCGPNSPLEGVAHIIWLNNFSLEQTRQLVKMGDLDTHTENLYAWTNGHPLLLQKLCSILYEKMGPGYNVDQAADGLVRGGDPLFYKIRVKLEKTSQGAQDLVKQILGGAKIPFSLYDPNMLELYLLDVIDKDSEHKCMISNKLYEEALRPYFPPIEIEEKPELQVIPDRPGVWIDDNGNVWVVDEKGDKRGIPRENLAPLERGLLKLLYESKGRVCTYREIADKVWAKVVDPGYEGTAPPIDSIHQAARRLREKIEPDPSNPCFIINVRSEGYKLVDPGNPSLLFTIIGFLAPLLIFGKAVSKGILLFGKGLLGLARWMDEILAVTVVLAIIVSVALVLLGKLDPTKLIEFLKGLVHP